MARRKRQDFWDDIEDDIRAEEKARRYSGSGRDEYIEYNEREGFHFTKCKPIQVIARGLLFVAAMAILLCGYTVYSYVEDRYVDGEYTSSYFESNGFSEAYNEMVEKLLETLAVVEAEGDITTDRAYEIVSGIMGTESNFAYYVTDSDGNYVVSSGDDAITRIESSNHFLEISNTDGELTVNSGIPSAALSKSTWQALLDECSGSYHIYTAVDNNLTAKDGFYEDYVDFQNMAQYYTRARIVGIAALIVFVLLLIYSVIATGRRKGYSVIMLSGFDRIFTEISLALIIVAVILLMLAMSLLSAASFAYAQWLQLGDAALLYIVIIRGYFSMVRRIKAGTFVTNSIIYKICHGINLLLSKLPRALKIIIIAVLLVALNGALIYALLYYRDVVVFGLPVIFIVAPVIFIIELIGFINCIFGSGNEDEDYFQDAKDLEARVEIDHYDETIGMQEYASAQGQPQEDVNDWETMDFSDQIREAEAKAYAYDDYGNYSTGGITLENVRSTVSDKTLVLSSENRNRVLDNLGFGETAALDTQAVAQAEAASQNPVQSAAVLDGTDIAGMDSKSSVTGKGPASMDQTAADISDAGTAAAVGAAAIGAAAVGAAASPAESESQTGPQDALETAGIDFIQLNKDVRKLYRMKLKERSIGVTLRAPQNPILVSLESEQAQKLLSILFENAVNYAQEDSRIYIDMYAQNGKMIYLMKNTIRSDRVDSTTAALGEGLKEARRIVQAKGGKLINSAQGDTYKVGILMDTVDKK